MEAKKFQELVLTSLAELKQDVSGLKQDSFELKQDVTGLKQDVSELKQDVSGLKTKLDLVYEHVVKLTETQTTYQAETSKRITKVQKDTASLAELYGKHEVEIRNIKSIIL